MHHFNFKRRRRRIWRRRRKRRSRGGGGGGGGGRGEGGRGGGSEVELDEIRREEEDQKMMKDRTKKGQVEIFRFLSEFGSCRRIKFRCFVCRRDAFNSEAAFFNRCFFSIW